MSVFASVPSLEELDRKIIEIASLTAQIETESLQEAIIFSHLLAAAYALRRAIAHESAEVTDPLPDDGDVIMRLVAQSIAAGEAPHESWLARFYLTAAIERLSAAEARLKRYRDVSRPDAPPKQHQIRLATQRTRAEEIATAVARLEDLARRIIP